MVINAIRLFVYRVIIWFIPPHLSGSDHAHETACFIEAFEFLNVAWAVDNYFGGEVEVTCHEVEHLDTGARKSPRVIAPLYYSLRRPMHTHAL